MSISRKQRGKKKIKNIILNLNPCYDHWIILKTEPKIPDVIRGDEVIRLIDGKGLNIARVLTSIFKNFNFKCINVLGGNVGKIINEYCKEESFDVENFWINGDNRINTAIVYEYKNEMMVINEPGPLMNIEEVTGLKKFVEAKIENDTRLIISGSAARGFTGEDLKNMVQGFRNKCILTVDIAGEWLNEIVKLNPEILKINSDELKIAFGIESSNFEEVYKFRNKYKIETLIITLGEKGSLTFDGNNLYKTYSKKTYSNFSVGSGDSFFAGLIDGLDEGADIKEALKKANASGAANSLNYGSGIFSLDEYQKMLNETVVEEIQ